MTIREDSHVDTVKLLESYLIGDTLYERLEQSQNFLDVISVPLTSCAFFYGQLFKYISIQQCETESILLDLVQRYENLRLASFQPDVGFRNEIISGSSTHFVFLTRTLYGKQNRIDSSTLICQILKYLPYYFDRHFHSRL